MRERLPFASKTAIIGPIDFFSDKPMLVDIMKAIIGSFGCCTDKPMQAAIIGRIKFSQWQANSGLAIIGPIESY